MLFDYTLYYLITLYTYLFSYIIYYLIILDIFQVH